MTDFELNKDLLNGCGFNLMYENPEGIEHE